MNFFGDSLITILLLILYMSLLTIFFNYARKIRMKVRKKKLIARVQKELDLEELPLHKNKEIYWEAIERKAKKLPDSREKYLLLRDIRDQAKYARLSANK